MRFANQVLLYTLLAVTSAYFGASRAVAGTHTTGGGTGADGRMLDGYIVDITKLPAYEQIVKPLIDNLGDTVGPHIEQMVKSKTWYLAPVRLNKFSKKVLGVSFVGSELQAIGAQSSSEIWIDSDIYNNMKGVNIQGEALVHEIVMALFFMKYAGFEDFCKASLLAADCNNPAALKWFDKIMPADPPHALTDTENSDIRAVTGWVLQNATQKVDEKVFYQVLSSRGFDRRFFNSGGNDVANLDMNGKEFDDTMRGLVLSGNFPQACKSQVTGKTIPCKVSYTPKSNPHGYDLTVNVHGKQIKIQGFLGDNPVSLSGLSHTDDGTVYSMAVVESRMHFRVGDRFRSGWMIFSRRGYLQKEIYLDKIILRPSVIYAIDKNATPQCSSRYVKETAPLNEGIVIHTDENIGPNWEAFLAEQPPISLCTSN